MLTRRHFAVYTICGHREFVAALSSNEHVNLREGASERRTFGGGFGTLCCEVFEGIWRYYPCGADSCMEYNGIAVAFANNLASVME